MINQAKNGILLAMPKLFIVFILMIVVLPTLGMIFGFNLGVIDWPHKSLIIYHALYYWSISIIATIIVLLSLTHYQLTKDKVTLCLGIAYLFAAYFNTAFTLLNEWAKPINHEVENIHAYSWVLSNTLTGLLLVISLRASLIKNISHSQLIYLLLIILSTFIVFNSYWFIAWLPEAEKLISIIYPENKINHPFGLINLVLYLYLAIGIYPKLYKQNPTILTHSILYIAITQVIMSCYMIFGSLQIYDTAYLGALLIQLMSYLIPFLGLVFSYLMSYDFALASQRELQKQKEKFEQLSTYDPLTELLNRRAFEETTIRIIEHAKRYNYQFTLLYIDLDNLKGINDSIGHDFGDELIKQVAKRLQQSIRTSDYCGRLGGDEFGVIFVELHDHNKVRGATEKLIRELNQPFEIKGNYLYTGASAGIAIYPEAGTTYQILLKNADTAMYQAKALGKNTYAFYTESLSKIHSRELEIESHLRKALDKNELYLVFQPIYYLAKQQIVGCEVLLRWNNTELEEVLPQEFIAIAESSGLIISIGNWIIQNACQHIKLWQEKYKKRIAFSINLSPVQLANTAFIHTVESNLLKHEIPAGILDLEIPETALVDPRLKIEENLIKLTKLGVTLSLDNFGTGCSSLKRLKSLPISKVKIDRSLILELNQHSDSAILIKAIIQLAHHLDKQVLAEGIETEEQLQFLMAQGCTLGQGFLFSHALKADEFEQLVFANYI